MADTGTRNIATVDDVAIPPARTRSQPENIYKLTEDITSQFLYVLTGPNYSNKRSLALKLQTDYPTSFKRIVSHTTRQPRPLETPGVDYIYITRGEFSQLIQDNKFLQYIHVDKSDTKLAPDVKQIPTQGDLFGVTKSTFHQASHSYVSALLLTLHPTAVNQIKSLPFKTKCIYLSPDKQDDNTSGLTDYEYISTADPVIAYTQLKKVVLPNSKVEKQSSDVPKSESLIAAQAEWENIETIQAVRVTDELNVSQNSRKVINSTHALEYFRNKRMLEYINRIRLPPEPTGVRKLLKIIFGPPTLHDSLVNERNLVLAMALHAFDNTDSFHTTVLDTVYRVMMKSQISCPRFGSHWEDIGFQGNDPATDLRGAGMLGLVNLFDFVTSPIACQIALDILKLSRDVTQRFPMCALSMSLTVIVITLLRDGKLSKICNSRGMVFSVVNDAYKALFYKLYCIWKYQHKTIWDSGHVLQELELSAKSSIQRLMNEFYNELERIKAGNRKITSTKNPSNEIVFQGIDEIDLELSLSTE